MSEMSNVKFLFLSGNHSLTHNITIQHVYNVTMIGDSYNSYSPPVIIFCNSNNMNIFFAFSFNIPIAKMKFEHCGGTGPTILPKYDFMHYRAERNYSGLAATLIFNTCYNCTIRYVMFKGYGIIANNLLGESYLEGIIIYLDVAKDLPHWYNQGIKLMNYGDSPHINYNLIHINKISVDGFPGSQPFHDYVDIGMRLDLEKTNYSTKLTLSESKFAYLYTQRVLQIGLLQGLSLRNTLLINNCKFQSNGELSTVSRSTIRILISNINMSLYFTNCLFYKNWNVISISILNYDNSFVKQQNSSDDYIFPVNWCIFPSYICIRDSDFLDNGGPLIHIESKKISTCFVQFSIIGPFIIHRNNANSEDLIGIYQAVVNIIGEAEFSQSIHARNIIFFHSCTVTFHDKILFTLSLHCDQILTVQSEFAYINVLENANIEFVDNSYNNYVIKAIVKDYIPYPPCFFQYITFVPKEASYTLLKITVSS